MLAAGLHAERFELADDVVDHLGFGPGRRTTAFKRVRRQHADVL